MNLEILDIVIFFVGAVTGFSINAYTKKQPTEQKFTTTEGISATTLQQDIAKKQLAVDNFFEKTNHKLEQTEQLVADLRY